jgi:hypothetical protein
MSLESGNSGHVLVDVLDRVLDKGIIIDAAVRVSIVGVELLGVDARVVVASIETYLRHADTIAYTDMAAAPKRTAPPLYIEPLASPPALEAGAPVDPAEPPVYAEPVMSEGQDGSPGPVRSDEQARSAGSVAADEQDVPAEPALSAEPAGSADPDGAGEPAMPAEPGRGESDRSSRPAPEDGTGASRPPDTAAPGEGG